MQTTFTVAILALAAYVAYTIVGQYRAASGSTWDRLLAAGRQSATILWTKFSVLLAALVSQLDNLADLAGAPEAKTFIDSWIGNPKAVAAIMLGLTAITFLARKRTM